ncbi:Arginine--tRNA ligase, cytoplasmic [Aduncisulcus paluster]|uniref:arginine--tRNA ligase n=1 Tax=Aduncisulcus paluster TaxID=2918883 RepID=A0ABQ5KTH3_9EUKA|nr:Arginine--tRNA ligase, cytoplasmic [Aduncisulcus paluster]
MSLLAVVSENFSQILKKAFEGISVPEKMLVPMITVVNNPKHGDFQINNALPISRIISKQTAKLSDGHPLKSISNPDELAQYIIDSIDEEHDRLYATKTITRGFINIRVSGEFLSSFLRPILDLGVQPPKMKKQRVAVDFSSPNIAKCMHVGHLRSTVIGDSVCRLLEFLGHDVLRINHVGDWGTQFGMLIAHLREAFPDFLAQPPPIEDLQAFYKEAKKRFDDDKDFAKEAHETVVKLQAGNEDELKAWKLLCDISRLEFQRIYDILDVKLEEVGESFYNPMLPVITKDMEDRGIARIDDGALCIFVPSFKFPFMIRKRDGGYTYDTTDLAAFKHRSETEKADWLVYVTDMGQATHFQLLKGACRMAGWLKDEDAEEDKPSKKSKKMRKDGPTIPKFSHVGFGLVRGADGKKFRTRSGETVRLQDLLDEAVVRARKVLDENGRSERFDEEKLNHIAKCIGISAIKYADLSSYRVKDYIFSFDRMLALKGNTAVYLMYSYVRIASISRKLGVDIETIIKEHSSGAIKVTHESERHLLLHLARFQDIICHVVETLCPHHLAEYLYDMCGAFTTFYENCRVLVEEEDIKVSRLLICECCKRVMETGFHILGVQKLDEM